MRTIVDAVAIGKSLTDLKGQVTRVKLQYGDNEDSSRWYMGVEGRENEVGNY